LQSGKKALQKDSCFRSVPMPPPATLAVPTMFKIVQNRPLYTSRRCFSSP